MVTGPGPSDPSGLPDPSDVPDVPDLPDEAYAAALAGFEEMTLARLGALLRAFSPAEAYAVAIGHGRPPVDGLLARVLARPEVAAAWQRSHRQRPVDVVWEQCCALGVTVSIAGRPGHPMVLGDDPQPVPVLFSRGDRGILDGRRVGVVGTRNATMAGRHLARALGEDLARAGVHVVSGLARGIDGHAHAGVLDAGGPGRAVAVVASGHDVVYPREHRRLWDAVAESGVVFSEVPPGTPPLPFRFPLRNRIVAALSEIVVVVESRERGGSLITADLAAERGVPVMAVPGHAASRAALGVNGLLRDGAAPVLDAGDVLTALSLDHTRTVEPARRVAPAGDDHRVWRLCVARACTLEQVADHCGGSLVVAARSLARLEQQGWVVDVDGWFEGVER